MVLFRAVVRFVVALFRFAVEYVKLCFRSGVGYDRQMKEMRKMFCDPKEAAVDKRRGAAILRDYFL